MEPPQPAEDWPDRPLSESEAADLLEDDVRAVWVMDPDGPRSAAVPPDAPENPVIDVVLETTAGFEMYSYTGGEWKDYGTQRHDDEDLPSMEGTLESYRVLAGESESF